MTAPTCRILSNRPGIARVARQLGVEHHLLRDNPTRIGRSIQLLAVALRSRRWDSIFLDCAMFETLVLATLLRLIPWASCRLVSADPILPNPKTRWQRTVASVKRVALQRVDSFVLYQRDFRAYTRWYGMSPARVRVLPFKVSHEAEIARTHVHDGDYAFATGISFRDWKTLAEATRTLSIPLVISVPSDAQVARMGMTTRPPNPADFSSTVRIVRDEGNLETWLELMARSRFVVLPLLADSISPSGLSVCLTAMALGKCVIISDGPTASALPRKGEAIFVAPGDADDLRAALLRIDGGRELRSATGRLAQAYASTCGGTERLHRDFVAVARELAAGGTRARVASSFEELSGRDRRAP